MLSRIFTPFLSNIATAGVPSFLPLFPSFFSSSVKVVKAKKQISQGRRAPPPRPGGGGLGLFAPSFPSSTAQNLNLLIDNIF